jgi:hypothetical protein
MTLDPHAFRMTTPRELEALRRGERLPTVRLEHPTAIQACSEEAEAAALRGVPVAAACRLVYVRPAG